MVERAVVDRLQPSLLDRLTDRAPGDRTEAVDERVIDLRRLRDIIRRDLSWLLNTNNSETQIDPTRFPHATRSTLNFGVREVAGDFSTEQRAELMRKSIASAIEAFEPRLKSGSVEVKLARKDVGRQSVIVFDIHATMWAQPLPTELYLRSQVDVTTGHVQLEHGG